MNFYKHHIGDYDAHTQHLTWSQDLSYRRLLSAYYLRERPLPNDLPMIYRLARATEAAQKASCRQVLGEFFYLSDDGLYHHRRCDKEIQQYQAQSSTNRSNAAHRIGHRNGSETQPNRSPNQNQIPEPLNTITCSEDLTTLPPNWWKSDQGILEAGETLGLSPILGEPMQAYKDRLFEAVKPKKKGNGKISKPVCAHCKHELDSAFTAMQAGKVCNPCYASYLQGNWKP